MAPRRVLVFLGLVLFASAAIAQSSLTGRWRCNDGGTYFVRQVGREVWWLGRSADSGGAFTNVFHGTIDGDTIEGDWADVPAGSARSSGVLTLRIQSDDRLVATRRTGNFSGSEWTREGASTGITGGGGGGTRTTKAPNEYRGRNGLRLTYDCPASPGGSVWGSDIYTDDSGVCIAAIHAGVIGTGGGTVTIEIREGRASYSGSTRNGVSSANYGQWGGSFVFVGGSGPTRTTGGARRVPSDTSVTTYRGQNGQRLVYDCPNGGGGSVWGSEVYTDDSNVCRAAVHAGIIDSRGGTVTIEVRPGRSTYKGSSRNGVASGDYGAWSGSFVFVEE